MPTKRKRQTPSSYSRSQRQDLIHAVDNNYIDKDYKRSKILAFKSLDNFFRKEYPDTYSDCSSISVEMFKDFCGGLTKPSLISGLPVLQSYSSINRYKLGLIYHFQQKKFIPSEQWKTDMKKFMDSVARTQGKQRENGDIEMYEGADAIPLEFHKFLCRFLLRRGRKKETATLI